MVPQSYLAENRSYTCIIFLAHGLDERTLLCTLRCLWKCYVDVHVDTLVGAVLSVDEYISWAWQRARNTNRTEETLAEV